MQLTGGAGGTHVGGGLSNSGDTTLRNALVTANMAASGGGISNAAMATLRLIHSTGSSNQGAMGADSQPGGNGGGACSRATLEVASSTFAANQPGAGGSNGYQHVGSGPAGTGGGLVVASGTTTVAYSTIAANESGVVDLAGTVELGGTIVADSTAANCAKTISEVSGFNLDSGTSCGFAKGTDLTGTDPKLGPLASRGGPTMALLAGSPAIDAAATRAEGCPALDQRGDVRPDLASDAVTCDIGAYESQG